MRWKLWDHGNFGLKISAKLQKGHKRWTSLWLTNDFKFWGSSKFWRTLRRFADNVLCKQNTRQNSGNNADHRNGKFLVNNVIELPFAPCVYETQHRETVQTKKFEKSLNLAMRRVRRTQRTRRWAAKCTSDHIAEDKNRWCRDAVRGSSRQFEAGDAFYFSICLLPQVKIFR